MKSNHHAGWHLVCADLRPDDGVPLHQLRKQDQQGRGNRKSAGHRTQQYCKVIAGILDAELEGHVIPGIETGCSLVSVDAESHGAVLLVVIAIANASPDRLSSAEAALQAAAGSLRAAIAAGLPRRRRVPGLRFRAVPSDETR